MEQKPIQPRVAAATEAPLPAERAFVVQLRAQTDSTEELFVGRAEHMASGATERFASAADLIAFMAKVLGPPRGVP
jgi:hypothetical protein